MSITAVPNSPIGWSDAAQSALQPKDSRYCQPWGTTQKGEDPALNFQLQFGKVGYDLSEGGAFVPYYTGVTTTVGANQIIDSGASFASPPALSQHIAVNTETAEQTALASPPVSGLTALDIDDDIFGSGTLGDGYAVVALRLPTGNVLYNGVDETVAMSPNISENSFIIEDFFPNTTDRFVVEVDIEDYAGGSLQVLAGSYPVTFTVLDDTTTGIGNGTWSFYGIPSGADLKIQDTSTESNYTIAGIRIYYIATPEVQIYEGDTFIETLNPSQYIHNRALFNAYFGDGEYTPGCYEFYVNNVNGLIGQVNFPIQDNPPWFLDNTGTGWSFVGNELIHTAGGGVGTNTAKYQFATNLDPRCNYVIEFRLNPGSDIPSVILALPLEDVNISAYLTSGTNYISFTGYAAPIIAFQATEVDNIEIDQFNVYSTFYNEVGGYFSPDLNEEVTAFRIAPKFCTPWARICYQDMLGPEYVLYESSITNSEASPVKKKNRWLPASETYTERCFVKSNVRFARWQDDDFESYRDSDGANRIVYSDPVEVKECQLVPVPVWQHAWMVWALRNDFSVNGDPYYPVDGGGYSPNWQRDTPNAPVVFEIAAQDQNINTTGCD